MSLYVPRDNKDLLIGAADLYDWSKINNWARSARESGFTGDIALLTYRVSENVPLRAKELSIDVYQIDHDPYGQAISHNTQGRNTQSHQMRFFHAWQLLWTDELYKNYNHVIMTDVRDVIFQKNPSEFFILGNKTPILNNLTGYRFVASSEAIQYKNEPWGADNMMNGFGPLVWEMAKEWKIYNVGVVAGISRNMMGLFLNLYTMTVGRYIPSDQSAYNILVNLTNADQFYQTGHSDNWAAQLGTTLDPQKSHYDSLLVEVKPMVRDGLVYNQRGQLFHIVHQWDRVPGLNETINQRYSTKAIQ